MEAADRLSSPMLPKPMPEKKWSPSAALERTASSPREKWGLAVVRGRLAELSGGATSAALTVAFRLIVDAQGLGEPVAWISDGESSFFPPDAAAAGCDLDTLVVIRLTTPALEPRAADVLARSGGFGLIILDLGHCPRLPMFVQSRLAGLARKHHTALLCLTDKPNDAPSLGSLVSLRAEATRVPGVMDPAACEVRILKSKGPGKPYGFLEVCRAPDGLR